MFGRAGAWLATLTIGCAQPVSTEPEPPPVPNDTGLEVVPPPLLTAEEVASTITAALAGGIPDPFLPRDTYLDLFAWADDSCPGGEPYSLPGDPEGCRAASGAWFYGQGAYHENPDGGEGFYLMSDCWIVDPDGARFDGGGELFLRQGEDGNPTGFYGMLRGTWAYEASAGWLAHEVSAVLAYGGGRDDAQRWNLEIDGSLSLDGTSLYFDDLRFDTSACLGAPTTGAVRLRDEAGRWYGLAFGDDCSGCGTITEAGVGALGTGCVEIADAASALAETLASSP